MRNLIAFVIMHLLPPVAVFAAWNEYRKRRMAMLVTTVVGSALAGCGLLLDEPAVGLAGLVVLVPPVVALRRDLRTDRQEPK
ncbi:hypothetical protein [Streptomyces sp. NPDC054865]